MAAAGATHGFGRRWLAVFVLALAAGSAGLAAGCGGSGTPAGSGGATSPVAPSAAAGSSAGSIVGTLVMDANDPAALYAGMDDGVYKWTEATARWERLPVPEGEGYRIHSEPFSARLYAQYLTTGGYRMAASDDGGATWEELGAAPRADLYLPDVWFWPTWGSAAVCLWGSKDGNPGVYLSADGGQTWSLLRGRDREQALRYRGWSPPRPTRALAAFLKPFGRQEQVTVTDAATGEIVGATGAPIIAPDRPRRFFLGTENGVYRSLDGGRTWRRMSDGLPGAAADASTTPLPVPAVAGTLVFDRVVASGTDFSGKPADYDLYLVQSDGTGLRRLTDGPGVQEHASWSPDGRRLVYNEFAPETLWVMDADGSHKRELTKGNAPSWSPDGRYIVYMRGDDIFVVHPDGSGERRVLRGKEGSLATPSWGPSGTILFSRDGDLCVAGLDGGGVRLLRPGTVEGQVSPDGTTVAAYDTGSDSIVAFPFRGDAPARTLLARASDFIAGGGEPLAAWTPDGSALVVGSSNRGEFRGSSLYVVNADGSGLSQVPDVIDALSPAWRSE